jgi:hypothetical protein
MINHNLGRQLHTNYDSALPFPHITIDNFIQNEQFLNMVVDEVVNFKDWGREGNDHKFQVKKWNTPIDQRNLEQIPDFTRLLLDYLNSPRFIKFVEDLTGIQGLIPDLGMTGGGLHKIASGGKLGIHTDYAVHPMNNQIFRRVNLLLYLNREWQPEWGGSLQLFEYHSMEKKAEVLPIFNRAVLFNTTDRALHGHPDVLMCPEDICRYSIAMYYFTTTPPDNVSVFATEAVWYDPKG